MQISASTLLASQQAAQIQPKPRAPGFAQALEKREGFSPLKLKQTGPAPETETALPPAPKGPARLGANLDIKI